MASPPILVIGGGRGRFYPTELFRETAECLPNARLIIYYRLGAFS
jgi:hypothetical protein